MFSSCSRSCVGNHSKALSGWEKKLPDNCFCDCICLIPIYLNDFFNYRSTMPVGKHVILYYFILFWSTHIVSSSSLSSLSSSSTSSSSFSLLLLLLLLLKLFVCCFQHHHHRHYHHHRSSFLFFLICLFGVLIVCDTSANVHFYYML